MYKYLLVICLLAGLSLTASAQQPDTAKRPAFLKSNKDTLVSTKRDSVVARAFKPKVKKSKVRLPYPDSTHSPHTAIMRSLMIPGWGQIYNHAWWKVPAIYGGLGLLGWAIVFNNTNYNEFLALSKYREHGVIPGPKDKYYAEYNYYIQQPDQALYDATDGYRRDRDLSILGAVGAWGINVIDAYIDAKFIHSYSVDNNLSMRIAPGVLNQPAYALNSVSSYIPGIKITFTF
jgi:hypothetical protein